MHEINEYYKKAESALKAGNYEEGAEHALIGLSLLKKWTGRTCRYPNRDTQHLGDAPNK